MDTLVNCAHRYMMIWNVAVDTEWKQVTYLSYRADHTVSSRSVALAVALALAAQQPSGLTIGISLYLGVSGVREKQHRHYKEDKRFSK